MRPQRPIPVADVSLDIRCSGLPTFTETPEEAVSTIQAIGDWNEIRARLPEGEERRVAGGVTLPGLLELREHVDRGNRGAPVVGMEAVPVINEGDRITIGFRPPLAGHREDALAAVDDMLETLFGLMRSHGVDSRAVVERVALSRGRSLGDPIAVHDRIAGRSAP